MASWRVWILMVALQILIAGPALTTLTAQTLLVIPLLGHYWPSKVLAVAADTELNSEQQSKLSEGLRVWTFAQSWFWQTYQLTDVEPYFLGQVNATSLHHVTVSFIDRSQIPGGGYASTTVIPSKGQASEAHVNIDKGLQGHLLRWALMHELGHVLGLGHITERLRDVMAEGSVEPTPSTLDLYGIYKVSKGEVEGDAALPASISFTYVPQEAIPEFENPAILGLALVYLTFIVVVRFRNGRPAIPAKRRAGCRLQTRFHG